MGLSPRQMFLLDEACKPIDEAFGHHPYLVGTASSFEKGSTYRDVDVRLILEDEKYDQIKEALGVKGIIFLGLSLGEYLASRSNLPIDFQIQRRTEANHHHPKKSRNPLGCRDLDSFRGDAPLLETPKEE